MVEHSPRILASEDKAIKAKPPMPKNRGFGDFPKTKLAQTGRDGEIFQEPKNCRLAS